MAEQAVDPRSRILHIASEMFAARGYAGARIDEIAGEANVNKAMVYYYVGDKDELYSTVIGMRADEAFAAVTAAAEAHHSPVDQLRAVIEAIARTAIANPHFAPLMLREIASGGGRLSDALLQKISSIFQVVRRVLERGRKEGLFRPVDPALTHMTIVGSLLVLISGIPIRRRLRDLAGPNVHPFSEREPDEIAAVVFETVLRGITADSSESPPKTRRSRSRSSK